MVQLQGGDTSFVSVILVLECLLLTEKLWFPCDIVIYKKYIYLVFVHVSGTEMLKSMEFPVIRATKLSFVTLMR